MFIAQTSLFPDDKSPADAIPGLNYIRNYISAHDESALISQLDSQPWLADMRRRVQHYGYRYDYKARSVGRDAYLGPLPQWLSELGKRLHADGIFPVEADQVIVNEYEPGQGISAHIDCVPCFGDPVASLSLGSSCVMEFSKPDADKQELLLEPRSLVVLSGDARYEWQHAIPGRKSDVIGGVKMLRRRRVSLTFRKVIAPG